MSAQNHHRPCVMEKLATTVQATEKWLPLGHDQAVDLLRSACLEHAAMAVGRKVRPEYRSWSQIDHLSRIWSLLDAMQSRIDELERGGAFSR